jgi:hypothetical protein
MLSTEGQLISSMLVLNFALCVFFFSCISLPETDKCLRDDMKHTCFAVLNPQVHKNS